MIQPSRRRRAQRSNADYLQIHKTLARRRVWSRKIWLASALACALSLILWLVATPVPWHLGAIASVFLLSLFAPLRPALDWALAWISRSGGLSYETALELEGTSDAYGFSEAVQKRAATQAARLELPEQQAWWLPLLFIAVVLALLPVVPFRTATRLPFDTGRIGTERNPETPPEPGAAPVTETENEENQEESESAAEQPESERDAASTIEDFNAPDGASPEANSERVADEEALERFLENMRERPQSEEEQVNPFSSVTPQPQEGESQQGEGEEGTRSESGEGEQGEQGQEGEQGEQGNSESQEAGEQSGEEGEEGESGEGGDEGSEETAGDPGESGDQGEGGEAGAGEGEQGEESGLLEEGDGSDGTGELPGSISFTETEDLGEPDNDPEQIRGQLGNGPSNLAGTVRLPGTVDGSEGTGGASAGNFNQTEEQAITEGRIPVEYQEIIRNYFR